MTIQIGTRKLTGLPQFLAWLILIGVFLWIAYAWPPWTYWPMWLSAAGWLAFGSYWGTAAKNSAAPKQAESTKSRRVHELLMNGGILLLFIAVPGLREDFLPASFLWVLIGLSLQAACFALAVWARRHLGTNWSGRIEIKTGHELIRTGPYRIVRHPIYTAMLGMCIGTALVDGQVHALIGVAMVMFAYWRKIRMEEAKLDEAFGSRYQDYRRATWRVLPGLY